MKEHKHLFKKEKATKEEKASGAIHVIKCRVCECRMVISGDPSSKKDLKWAWEVVKSIKEKKD